MKTCRKEIRARYGLAPPKELTCKGTGKTLLRKTHMQRNWKNFAYTQKNSHAKELEKLSHAKKLEKLCLHSEKLTCEGLEKLYIAAKSKIYAWNWKNLTSRQNLRVAGMTTPTIRTYQIGNTYITPIETPQKPDTVHRGTIHALIDNSYSMGDTAAQFIAQFAKRLDACALNLDSCVAFDITARDVPIQQIRQLPYGRSKPYQEVLGTSSRGGTNITEGLYKTIANIRRFSADIDATHFIIFVTDGGHNAWRTNSPEQEMEKFKCNIIAAEKNVIMIIMAVAAGAQPWLTSRVTANLTTCAIADPLPFFNKQHGQVEEMVTLVIDAITKENKSVCNVHADVKITVDLCAPPCSSVKLPRDGSIAAFVSKEQPHFASVEEDCFLVELGDISQISAPEKAAIQKLMQASTNRACLFIVGQNAEEKKIAEEFLALCEQYALQGLDDMTCEVAQMKNRVRDAKLLAENSASMADTAHYFQGKYAAKALAVAKKHGVGTDITVIRTNVHEDVARMKLKLVEDILTLHSKRKANAEWCAKVGSAYALLEAGMPSAMALSKQQVGNILGELQMPSCHITLETVAECLTDFAFADPAIINGLSSKHELARMYGTMGQRASIDEPRPSWQVRPWAGERAVKSIGIGTMATTACFNALQYNENAQLFEGDLSNAAIPLVHPLLPKSSAAFITTTPGKVAASILLAKNTDMDMGLKQELTLLISALSSTCVQMNETCVSPSEKSCETFLGLLFTIRYLVRNSPTQLNFYTRLFQDFVQCKELSTTNEVESMLQIMISFVSCREAEAFDIPGAGAAFRNLFIECIARWEIKHDPSDKWNTLTAILSISTASVPEAANIGDPEPPVETVKAGLSKAFALNASYVPKCRVFELSKMATYIFKIVQHPEIGSFDEKMGNDDTTAYIDALRARSIGASAELSTLVGTPEFARLVAGAWFCRENRANVLDVTNDNELGQMAMQVRLQCYYRNVCAKTEGFNSPANIEKLYLKSRDCTLNEFNALVDHLIGEKHVHSLSRPAFWAVIVGASKSTDSCVAQKKENYFMGKGANTDFKDRWESIRTLDTGRLFTPGRQRTVRTRRRVKFNAQLAIS